MREIRYYEASDGTLFNTIEKCKKYEENSKKRIIDDFKGLIVRQAEGIKITDEGSAFPLAELAECWWYAVIVMRTEDDYEKVKRYAELIGIKNSAIEKIYGTEILIGIGEGNKDKCDYTWFYWYGTIDEAVEKYKKALTTFNLN